MSVEPSHHAGIVHVRGPRGGGLGFLVAPRIVCTCAHVVAGALGCEATAVEVPGEPLAVAALASARDETATPARVVAWRPVGATMPEDVAFLELEREAAATEVLALAAPATLRGRAARCFGVPAGTDAGVWVDGVLGDTRPNGTVQLEMSSAVGLPLQAGFSGAPVIDRADGSVLGMVVTVAGRPESGLGTGFLVPAHALADAGDGLVASPAALRGPRGLVSGVRASRVQLEGFLDEYVGSPGRPVAFGGRDPQLRSLDEWLDDGASPHALVVANAGRGKSAIVARWVACVHEQARAHVVFVPISIRFGTNLRQTALRIALERLRHVLGEPGALPADPEVWAEQIALHLGADRPPGAPPLLVVFDGLDEAAGWRADRDLPVPRLPGRGVKTLVTARRTLERDAAGWQRALGWREARRIELPPLDRAGVAQVLASLPNGEDVEHSDEVVGELARVTGGDPLLVWLYAEAIGAHGFLAPSDLGRLVRGGLHDYFTSWWSMQEEQWRAEGYDPAERRAMVTRVLSALAVALGALERDALGSLADVASGFELEARLVEIARWVVEVPDQVDPRRRGLVLAHPRLAEHFRDAMLERELRDMRERFVAFCAGTLVDVEGGGVLAPSVRYGVQYYGAHLEEVEAPAARFDALVTPAWMRAWEAIEAGHEGFLEDVARAARGADRELVAASSTSERRRALVRQVRLALIASSIASLAQSLRPPILRALVATGDERWPATWALSHIQRKRTDRERGAALAELAPALDERSAVRALELTEELSGSIVDTALAALVPVLPGDLLPGVLARLGERPGAPGGGVLGTLAPRLPPADLDALLELADRSYSLVEHASTLACVSRLHADPQMRSWLRARSVATARTSADARDRVVALCAVARALGGSAREQLAREALVIAASQIDPRRPAPAVDASLVAALPPDAAAALAAAQVAEAVAARILFADAELDVRASRSRRVQAAQRALQRAALTRRRLRRGSPPSPPIDTDQARSLYAGARAIAPSRARIHAVAALVPHLDAASLEDAARRVRAEDDPEALAHAVAALAPRLSDAGADALVDAIAATASEPARAAMLAAAGPHLPVRAELRAIELARGLADPSLRVDALLVLAERRDPRDAVELLEEALAVEQRLRDRAVVDDLLAEAGKQLAREAPAQAFALASSLIEREPASTLRAWLVTELAAVAPDAALRLVRAASRPDQRVSLLLELAARSEDPVRGTCFEHALAAVGSLYPSGELPARLVSELPSALLPELLDAVVQLDVQNVQLWLEQLGPRLIAESADDVLLAAIAATAQAYPEQPGVTAWVDAACAARMEEPARARRLQALIEATERGAAPLRDTLGILAVIGDRLPQPLVEPASGLFLGGAGVYLLDAPAFWEAARALLARRPDTVAEMASELLQRDAVLSGAQAALIAAAAPEALAEQLVRRALAERSRSAELLVRHLLPCLTMRAADALLDALDGEDVAAAGFDPLRALPRLAPRLSDDGLARALERRASPSRAAQRALVVAACVERIPPVQRDALVIDCAQWLLTEPMTRDDIAALERIVPFIPSTGWDDVTSRLSTRRGRDGDAGALAVCAPHLPIDRVAAAFATETRTTNDYNALGPLAERLVELPAERIAALWTPFVRRLATRPRAQALQRLADVLPLASALGGPEALAELAQGVADVGDWFP